MPATGRLTTSLPLVILALAAAALALLAGCGEPAAPSAKPIDRDPNLLVVYCACGLLPAAEAARDEFLVANPEKRVEITACEPLELVSRIADGEVPDIVVGIGEAEIGELERQGHLDRGSRHAMGGLNLAIAVPPGNPAGVRTLRDLMAERVRRIAVATPGMTSQGTVAQRELEKADIWESLQEKITIKQTALEVLDAVCGGEADAALIYRPCLMATPQQASESESSSDETPEETKPQGRSPEIVSPMTGEGSAETRIYAVLHKQSPNGLLAQRLIRALEAKIGGETAEAETETPAESAEPAPDGDSEAPT